MARKVRLDLMVGEETKAFLQRYARMNGASISETIERLVVDHLMADAPRVDVESTPADAVLDMILVQELQSRLSRSIGEGKIEDLDLVDDVPAAFEGFDGILYIPSVYQGFAAIAAEFQFNEGGVEVVRSYGGSGYHSALRTVDAFLMLPDELTGIGGYRLVVVPKGQDPCNAEGRQEWASPISWNESKIERLASTQ